MATRVSPSLRGPYRGCEEKRKKRKVKSLSRVRLFVTPWTVARQAAPSMRFSKQEYPSELPVPSPGHLPNKREAKPSLVALRERGHLLMQETRVQSSGDGIN